jgi:serine protease Do
MPALRAGNAEITTGGRRWLPQPGRARTLRIALLASAMAAAAASQTPASAAMAPGTCDAASVVARDLPAIVNITVVKVGKGEDGSIVRSAAAHTADKPGPEHIEVFVGSGSIIDPSGIIITNKHVIQGAALIRVILSDKTEVPAQLIAASSLVDIALLKIDMPKPDNDKPPPPLPTLQFANSDKAQLGQPVIAIGNPLGLGTSISTGVISALNRDLMRTPFDDFIQTDASINPGNSGGPLIDCAGDMIGVNTALLSNNKLLGSIGLGFAMPSNSAKFVASKLMHPEADLPNWVGLHLQDLTSELADVFSRKDMSGAIVTGVDPDSPAAHASLVPGDIITAANGHDLSDSRAVLREIVTRQSGTPIVFSISRQGQMVTASVSGQPWPHMMALRSDVLASPSSLIRAEAAGLGLHVTAITPENRKRFGLTDKSGVVVDQVATGSQAETIGLEAGDVIERIGDKLVTSPDQVSSRLKYGDTADGDHLALLVHGKTATRWVSLYVGWVSISDLVAGPKSSQPGASRNATAGVR